MHKKSQADNALECAEMYKTLAYARVTMLTNDY